MMNLDKHFNNNGLPCTTLGGVLTILMGLAIGAGMMIILIAFWTLAEVMP